MQMVGTQNAHNLITSSTDGMVCSWLVDMLAQPQVRVDAPDDPCGIDAYYLADRKHWSWCTLAITKPTKFRSQRLTFLTMRQPRFGWVQRKVTYTKRIDMIVRVRKRVCIKPTYIEDTLDL